MAKFFYRARKGPRELKEGTIEAESQAQAMNKLMQMGYFPIGIINTEARGVQSKRTGLFQKIRHRDLIDFTRQLSDLLESGLTLFRALVILQQQAEHKQLKLIIKDVADLVKEGKSLSESLKYHPKVFDNMYVNMVKAGEVSGTLEKVLKRLADFGEKQEDTLAKVRQAMAYPAFIAVVGIATIIVLFTFVIPRLIELFQDMGQILPLPTRMLIAISEFILNYWWLIAAFGAFVYFAIRRSLFTAKGRLSYDRFKLGLPVLGKFYKRVQVANFSRTLGTLLANGVPILQAMQSVAETLENAVLIQETKEIARQIKEGSTLAGAVTKSKYFSVLVGNMISIGEQGGKLDSALLRIAAIFEKQIDQSVRVLTSLIEPVMILVMGSIVGFIVISMLLPIFQISLIAR
jgi:type II secretion system protein F